MYMQDVLEKIGKIGIIPVIVLEDAGAARALGEALVKGGLACAEITFRTEAAEEAIRIMARECPEVLLGAGTVLTTGQADRAMEAGAKFLVSPGYNPQVAAYCVERGYPMISGTQTPGEMEQAMAMGMGVVKFFPAELSGGLPMIKAVAAPYPELRFIPTGGIDASNVRTYLACDRVLACGGSWMVKKEFLASGDFARIETLVREAAAIVKEVRG